MRDIGNSKGGDGGGVSKVKIYKGKYEPNMDYPKDCMWQGESDQTIPGWEG